MSSKLCRHPSPTLERQGLLVHPDKDVRGVCGQNVEQ
jgi:hypothetical protein